MNPTSSASDTGVSPPPEPRQLSRFGVILTIVEVVVGVLVFSVASRMGAAPGLAYGLSTCGPLLGVVVLLIKDRALSAMSVAMAAFTVLSAVAALIGHGDPKWLLYKDSVATVIIGIVFLASIPFGRPLNFAFALRFMTDGSAEQRMAFERKLDSPIFRSIMVWTTAWVGGVFVVEAVTKAVLIHQLGFDEGFDATTVMPVVAAVVAFLGVRRIARGIRERAHRS